RLRALVDAPPADVPIHPERAVAWFERESGLTLAPGQRDAIVAAIRGKVTVITGGPGTGKTTLVRGLTRIFGLKDLRLALCAPTGRASRRLSEAAGIPAKTIHRLLEWNPARLAPARDLARPLEADVVIVDESSMIDIFLLRQLLEAVPAAARVVFVGDADQLPSVGPGSVLRDIIASGVAGTVRLTEIFRQDARSLIVSNAHAVLHGEMPEPLGEDFAFLERDNPEAALAAVVELATRELPRRLGVPPAEIQVLVPMHKGTLGAIALNAALQGTLNPDGARIVPSRPLRVGDKVMQVRNNYELDVFNGDLGIVVSASGDAAMVRFYDRNCAYEADELDQLETAYACTIHKSQGSEYAAVVVALHRQHFPMLQRNLLYTAITRGKKFVAIVGSRGALAAAVANDSERLRWTRLAARLSGEGRRRTPG
ncbi:MAG: AAA family ATPase, partial [Candidatus Brocadiae bacterium]|nr:AAA family ATPase [Candidatus Brocadiia bacterium]